MLLIPLCMVLTLAAAYLYCDRRLEMGEVYVARYSLSNRTLISEEEIEKIRVPLAYLGDDVCRNKEDIVGRYVKIDTLIPKGSFFYEGALDDAEDMKDSIAAQLKEGEVSYDIYVNDIRVNQAYLVKGLYVDIYLTINKERVLSDLLINNIRIIGLYDVKHSEIRDYDREAILESICLAVPKESVAYLNKARAVGTLSITIGESTYEDVKSVLNRNAAIFEYLD